MPIPRAYNDGRPIPTQVRDRFEQAIVDQVGGFTLIRGIMGAWADSNGEVYRDESDLYVIATDVEEGETVVQSLALLAAELFDQRAVFYTGAPRRGRLVSRQAA